MNIDEDKNSSLISFNKTYHSYHEFEELFTGELIGLEKEEILLF